MAVVPFTVYIKNNTLSVEQLIGLAYCLLLDSKFKPLCLAMVFRLCEVVSQ